MYGIYHDKASLSGKSWGIFYKPCLTFLLMNDIATCVQVHEKLMGMDKTPSLIGVYKINTYLYKQF